MRLLLLLCLSLASLSAEEIEALYLSWYGDPTTTMTVQWHTSTNATEETLYLETPDGAWHPFRSKSHPMLGAPFLVHTLSLENLLPDTLYRFRIGTEEHSFRTAPKSLEKPLRFVIGGDLYRSPKIFRAMSAQIAKEEPLFAALGGDLAYALVPHPFRLGASPLQKWRRFLAEWKRSMQGQNQRLIPFLVVPGNHDITPKEAPLFFNLFGFPKKQLYRAVDFSDYLSLILLDTGHFHPIEGSQTQWLQEALASRTKFPFLFAIYHEGAYPSFYFPQGPTVQAIRAHWCPLFDNAHLQAAFEHHSHTFKKSYPLKQNQVQSGGTLYFGDGCWGVPPRIPKKQWFLEKEGRKNHVYLIELSPNSASIKAIGLGGALLDETLIPVKKNR